MDAFSSFFNRFGSKQSSPSSSTSTVQRQNTVATTLSHDTTPEHVRQRRATITDSNTVAAAFNSGDADQISGIMKKHMVRVNQTGLTQGRMNFGVREAFTGSSTRRDSSTGELREMKTFELYGKPKESAPQFEATYFPMTDKNTAWSGTPGDKTLQQSSVNYTEQRTAVAVTTPLSGCSVIEREDHHLAHVQPFSTAGGNSTDMQMISKNTQKSTRQLQLQRTNTDVFGPQEYGNYKTPGDQSKRHASAFVVKDTWGNNQVLSQTAYGDKDSVNKLNFTQRAFGPQPRYQINTPPSSPITAPVASTSSATNNKNTLSIPASKRPITRTDSRPT